MHWIHHHSIDSTNTAALAEATQRWLDPYGSQACEPVLVSADRQTAGRGRQGRSWASPIGGAYFTLAYPWPADVIQAAALVPLVTGLAVRAAVLDAVDLDPDQLRIKWPNDLLVDDAKLAGILCERSDLPDSPETGGGVWVVVVGVGINVNSTPDALGELRLPATSLRDISGIDVDTRQLVEAAAGLIAEQLDQLQQHGWTGSERETYNDALAWRGREVSFIVGGRDRTGTIVEVNSDGHLVVQPTGSTSLLSLHSGEVDRVALSSET